MGYQFLHIESYGRKAGKGKAGGNSVRDVVDEVTRKPEASPHVPDPQRPKLVFGCDPHQLPQMAESYAVTMASTFTRKNRKTGVEESVTRKMREDGLVMIGGVFSAPAEMPVGDWPEYRAKMVEKLQDEFGDRLKSVQEHFDEPFRHCHFYIIPRPGEHFDQVHPGKCAAAQAKDEGGMKGQQNTAYIEAMRKWQDSYWHDVSNQFALARIGPKKQRVTRSEWQAQQVALVTAAQQLRKAQEGMERWQQAEAKLKRQHDAVSARKAEVEEREERLQTVGGRVGLLAGGFSSGFVTALQAAKDWLIERSLWPGVKRSHEIEQNALEAIRKRDETIQRVEGRVEGLQRQIDRSKRQDGNVADLQKQLAGVKGQLAKTEGYNAELAQENNDLRRALRNNQPKPE